MRIIYNNIIPPKGFKAINLFGILFARKGAAINARTIRHETIHTKQMKEMFYVLFYLWYVIEWFLRLIVCHDTHIAYKALKMEREAYDNELDESYITNRKHYAWLINY